MNKTPLKRFVDDRGLRPKRVAIRAGIDIHAFYRMLRGQQTPDAREAGQIVQALNFCTGAFVSIEHLWPPDRQKVTA